MEERIVETWSIHNRINLYLLDAITEEALRATPPSRGRSAFQLFAHMHSVRLMWLKAAAPELLGNLEKIEDSSSSSGNDSGANDAPLKEKIREALEKSGAAVETLLRQSLASGGKVKGFKPHVAAFLGYLISHESHHRGQMTLALKQAGHPLDNKTDYGLWEWGVR
jgi:uncharacterized damage-inducible protein DinB